MDDIIELKVEGGRSGKNWLTEELPSVHEKGEVGLLIWFSKRNSGEV